MSLTVFITESVIEMEMLDLLLIQQIVLYYYNQFIQIALSMNMNSDNIKQLSHTKFYFSNKIGNSGRQWSASVSCFDYALLRCSE